MDCLRQALEDNGGKIPKVLCTDNGRMFTSMAFEDFCTEMGIPHHRTSSGSPWENGKVERLFGTIRREWISYRRYMKTESLRESLEEFQFWFNNEREIQKLEYKIPMQIMRQKSSSF